MPVALRLLANFAVTIALCVYVLRQCRKPSGWLGRGMVKTMNRSHAALTAWGLEHIPIRDRDTVLDIGCGGGQTVGRLAALTPRGKVHAVDYSAASVAATRAHNLAEVESGHVQVQEASVSRLPFDNDFFDAITAIETHYYWPDYVNDLREVCRVLKPGGSLLIVAESYRREGGHARGMKLLGGTDFTPTNHRDSLTQAGYTAVEVFLKKGWLCALARKPDPASPNHIDATPRVV
ncbi:MAG TPA: class I SAM-dependent methyltransferase [Bryobacteraceae bacterium]|jgi:SAM-dependent methyltransferase